MSKYIIERPNVKHIYLAYIAVFLLIFNVYHNRLMIIFSLYSPTATLVIQGIAVAMLILYLILDKNVHISDIKIQVFDILLLLSLAVIIITTKDFIYNMTYMIRYAVLILIVMLMKYDEKLMKIFFRCILLAGILHIVVTFWFYFDRDFYLENILPHFDAAQQSHLYAQVVNNNHATGLGSHYSQNGMYIAIALCCVYTLFFSDIQKKKSIGNNNRKPYALIITSVLFATAVVALFMTGKRGVLIFAIFAIVVTYYICNRSSTISKIFLIVLICSAIALLLYVLSFYIEGVLVAMERLTATFFPDGEHDISNGRFDLYSLAWRLFKENPILGIGWREFTNIAVPVQTGNAELLDTHNVFLQLLCETGVVGFAVFVAMFITGFVITFIYAVKSKKDKNFMPESSHHMIVFSLCYQIFFFGYCITGNPLYDLETLYVYIVSLGMSGTVFFKYKLSKKEKTDSKYIIE